MTTSTGRGRIPLLWVGCILWVLVVAACGDDAAPGTSGSGVPPTTDPVSAEASARPVGEPGTAVVHEGGWSTPIRLGFNDDGWEDSPYLTRDGSALLFFYHPWPDLATSAEEVTERLVADPVRGEAEGLDGKLYVSRFPFVTKEVLPISDDTGPAFECCPYVASDGRLFYVSNRRTWEEDPEALPQIHLDGRALEVGGDPPPSNPHWCEARDELWFDCPGDADICVMRDAAVNDFAGPVEKAPYPVNAADREAVEDAQPFLTDDCETLYISSSRGDPALERLEILRLERRGDRWSEPERFISAPTPVAELSMTADGRRLAFAQVTWRDDGTPAIDIYWAERR
ncbi:MAG TPA: hypothetical protein ENK55_08295 [Actinobacteria bacterium]|nr:hypothetical protein [Actinomycetota bacterium]